MSGQGAQSLARRLDHVQADIAQACAARPAGRNHPVTLIAVSKYQSVSQVCALYDLGVRDFGENYVQEFEAKATAVAQTGRTPRWHFIGALQSNKAQRVRHLAHVVHTVAGLRLAQRLASHDATFLMQVRQSKDPNRPGVAQPQALALAKDLLASFGERFAGVMAVPPQGEDPRTHFAALMQLSRAICALPGGAHAHEVSMGMSEDFRVAIGEGATMVRVGTALFGPRPSAPGEH